MGLIKKPFGQIVPQIEEVGRLVDEIIVVASSRVPVLIMGPHSTGIDLVAQAIHLCSPRAGRPFVTARCAMNHGTIVESYLSHVRKRNGDDRAAGAARNSLFETANGGTLFVDQVQNANPAVQLELLRLITDQEYVDPAHGEVQRTDIRLVLSAWIDLPQRCASGEFRRDLYERINVVSLEVRRGCSTKEWFFDVIGVLRDAALGRHGSKRLPAGLVTQITQYSWSSQVRSLQEAIAEIVRGREESANSEEIFFEVLRTIGHRRVEDLAQHNLQAVSTAVERCVDTYEFFGGRMYDTLLGQIQRALIQRAMIQCNGTLSRAASILGMSTNLLEAKLQELGLQ
ncbi:MAG TPA: sigma 54-interacting transcriptional regulator [Phycisphaerae bacterium]|nr:sigma 54-interacting transcriptional regulator [Phycisphaerae bacterium]